MKKIALITVGMNPVPAIKGGAVENLIQYFLDANELIHKYDIVVYSVYDLDASKIACKYKYTTFYFIKTNSFLFKIKRVFRAVFNHCFYYTGNEYLVTIQNLMDKKEFDLIFVENFPMAPLLLRQKYKVPIVLHIHNDWINIDNKYSMAIYNSTDMIYTVSDYIKDRISAAVKSKDKMITLYNGVDCLRFSAMKNNESYFSLRQKYRIKDNDIVFIFSGRMHPDKGIKEMLIAFSNLRLYNNVKLLLVGASSYAESKDSLYFKEVRILANNLKDRVIFTNYISYDEIHLYYHLADVFLSTSMCNEALSLSVIEAMAASLPIIAFRSGGIPELLNNDNSILIDKDKNLLFNLENAMSMLIENPGLREKMGRESFELSKRFTLSLYIDNLFENIDAL